MHKGAGLANQIGFSSLISINMLIMLFTDCCLNEKSG